MAEKMAEATSMRLPVSLREKLERAAKSGGRSMNAEIRLRLEQSFEASENETPAAAWELKQLRDDLTKLAVEVATLKSRLPPECSWQRIAEIATKNTLNDNE